MLAHITTWHDLTTEAIARFAETGEPTGLPGEGTRTRSTSARRAASEGRTSGEVDHGHDGLVPPLSDAPLRL